MLILTRRVGESVVIGEDVTVTVLGVKGNQVRIGINAPKTVAVHREEIFERIKNGQGADGARLRTSQTPFRGRLCPSDPLLRVFFASQSPAHYDCAPRRDGRVVEGAPLLRV